MHEGQIALLIPILGIVFTIGLPLAIAIVWIVLDHRKRRRLIELNHAERMAAIERGMEVPPLPIELLTSRRARRQGRGLLPGLILGFLGMAFLFVSAVDRGDWSLTPGAICLALGVAFLLYYFIEGRKPEATTTTTTL